jgi:hypothetical protein
MLSCIRSYPPHQMKYEMMNGEFDQAVRASTVRRSLIRNFINVLFQDPGFPLTQKMFASFDFSQGSKLAWPKIQ